MEAKLWSVEWCEKQGCFHVDYLKSAIQKNTENFLNEAGCDWSLLGVFDSHKKAHEFVKELRKARNIPTLEQSFLESLR